MIPVTDAFKARDNEVCAVAEFEVVDADELGEDDGRAIID
jgi:hypothetical protein